MSTSTCRSERLCSLLGWFVGVVGSFLVLGLLTLWLRGPDLGAPDAARAEFRRKAAADVAGAAAEANVYKVEDVNKGWYRVPVARAAEIVAEEWKDPAAGREKLLKRYENSQKQVSFE